MEIPPAGTAVPKQYRADASVSCLDRWRDTLLVDLDRLVHAVNVDQYRNHACLHFAPLSGNDPLLNRLP